MKIKCGKTAIMWDSIGMAIWIGVCVWMILSFEINLSSEADVICMIIMTMFLGFLARFWLSDSRTLIMDEEGCTVCLWFIRKKYLWKNLRVKRIEHYYTIPGNYDYYYTDAAVFSVHKIHKPRWMHALTYSNIVHPFSFFFVYFSLAPDIREKVGKPLGGTRYEVDEEMFLEKLKSWNVELEDTRVRRRRRRM